MRATTFIAGLLLAACAPGPNTAEPGVMLVTETHQSASFIRNFNPLLEVGDVRWAARGAMYEPMLIFNPMTASYVPWLAERYAWSEDHRTLTFHLRAGVQWSDGEAFTAHDVAFTFALLRRHPVLDQYGVWRFVSDVRATDERTVEVSLSRAFVPGLYYLAQQVIVPRHVWQDVADPVAFTNPNPVATGPFTRVTAFRAQAYQVEANPRYWQPGKPRVRGLRFLAFPANDQTNLAIVNGELDWAGNFVPAIDRIYVGKDPEHHHYWFPLVDGMVMLYANTTLPPLDDARVRKALSMAIDRALVVKVAMHGYTRPADATGLSDAYTTWRSDEAVARGTWTRHDPDAARALLAEAPPLPALQLMVPAGFSDWVVAAQVIARSLREAGVRVEVQTYDFNAWYEKIQTGDYQLSLGWTEVGPTPYYLYRSLMSTHTVRPIGEGAVENWHRFGLARADELFAELEATHDPARERALTDELQLLFVDHAPCIPLFPGPLWGQYNTARFTGFPDADNPYAPLSPHKPPQNLLVITEVAPR